MFAVGKMLGLGFHWGIDFDVGAQGLFHGELPSWEPELAKDEEDTLEVKVQ